MRKRNQNFVEEKSAVPLEKKSCKNLDKTSHESDNEEAELELFLFGEKKEKLIEECNFPDKISSISSNNEESSDLLAFTISTTPDIPSDKMSLNDQYQESFPIQLNKKKELKPAWVDEDDKEVCISLDKKSLKRYKKSANEDQVNGLKYQERLKSHFEKVQPVPSWAELNDEKYLENEESNDDDYLSNSSRSLLKKSEKLSKGFIDIVRVKDLNSTQPSNACITSLQFHPTAKIAFTSSLNKRLNMFQVDGRENASLQSIFIDNFPIYCARFISNGNRIVLSSRRKFFYNYDLNSGQVLKIPELRGREDLSLENFEVSPDGEIIAFLGESGYINMVSSKTSQYMYSLKMNGKVLSAGFSSDSSKLYTTGRDGEVYVWDLKSRRCQQKFVDDGSTKSTSLSVSNNGAYIAVGSNSGVVNVYNGTGSIERNPSPLKAVLNLTTKIDRILFNPTSEILTFSSPQSRNALRMVHLPSLTTFSNWPTEKQTLGRISCMNFSPLSGYFGIGNEMGKALLFRLKNFPDS
ncbi:U3 small nucleolar RNA-associated protein 18 homolog isoform X1 [Hydra vulgaris]|uniref:U3 small nucleolar RNA-associated protein 18 homolog isoform X1 n=1 Tax=Hydra vulgaris TaxID=6087 RepID=UPI001F5EEF91|nr:U3 small nucleolar RNA-associated protein 18 homolog [Hydra vulgaris]